MAAFELLQSELFLILIADEFIKWIQVQTQFHPTKEGLILMLVVLPLERKWTIIQSDMLIRFCHISGMLGTKCMVVELWN